MQNMLSNNRMADDYERRIQTDKLRPIGRAYLNNYKHHKVDNKTTILIKPKNLDVNNLGKVTKKQ